MPLLVYVTYDITKGKSTSKGLALRKRYSKLWGAWCSKLYDAEDVDNPEAEEGFDVIKSVVDLLIAFSAQPLVNVRDAVTEAAMIIGQKLLQARAASKKQLGVSQRQYAAEQQRLATESTSKSKTSARLTAVQKQCNRIKDSLEKMDEVIGRIYGSIFVHRYKDVHDDVRAHCIRHMGLWMLADPSGLLKDDYLKYVGWLLSDPHNNTRYEAVAVLFNIVEVGFSDKHISLACFHFFVLSVG